MIPILAPASLALVASLVGPPAAEDDIAILAREEHEQEAIRGELRVECHGQEAALAAVEADQLLFLAVFMVSSLLNIAYLIPVAIRGFLPPAGAHGYSPPPPPRRPPRRPLARGGSDRGGARGRRGALRGLTKRHGRPIVQIMRASTGGGEAPAAPIIRDLLKHDELVQLPPAGMRIVVSHRTTR